MPANCVDCASTNSDEQPEAFRRVICLGSVRTCHNLQCCERGYLVLALLALLASFVFTIWRIINPIVPNDRILAIALLLATIFSLIFVLNGVLKEQPYEMLAFIGANLLMAVYVVTHFALTYNLTSGWEKTIKLVRLAVSVGFLPFTICIGFYLFNLYWTGGALIQRRIGNRSNLQEAARRLFFCHSTMLFDFQIQLVMLILSVGDLELHNDLWVILDLAVGIPFAIVWSLSLCKSVQFERPKLTCACLWFGLLQPAYAILILGQFIWNKYWSDVAADDTNGKNSTSDSNDSTPISNISVSVALIVAAVCAIVFRVVLMVASIRARRDFGKGLRDALTRDENDEPPISTAAV